MIEKVLKQLNIAALNHMQAASIEAAKKHKHIVLLSPTGSGKTLGFLLPILSRLDAKKEGVQALILVPSRELGLQIEQVFKQMSTGFKVNCCYGGHPTKVERNNLLHPPALLIGTPGRIAYHVRHENFDTSTVTALVLDEFDKALEFGFLDDMSSIISELPNLERRTLTSATQMDEIPDFTGLKEPIEINYLSKSDVAPKGLELKQVNVKNTEKTEDLFNLICKLGAAPALVFCNHRDAVERISEFFHRHKMNHGIFHGKMEQEDRERALIKFRNGSYRLLITTDLASRGLDIPEIQNVIHYQMPLTAETFTHRNGRTARMHATGTSFLILSEEETLPDYITEELAVETLDETYPMPENTDWGTLYIAAGKKDKVNKVDIVGLLLQKGKLQKEELGRIEVLDFSAYAAVKRSKMGPLVKLLKEERIKNKKIKMEASY